VLDEVAEADGVGDMARVLSQDFRVVVLMSSVYVLGGFVGELRALLSQSENDIHETSVDCVIVRKARALAARKVGLAKFSTGSVAHTLRARTARLH
jgi:hypothetical protein